MALAEHFRTVCFFYALFGRRLDSELQMFDQKWPSPDAVLNANRLHFQLKNLALIGKTGFLHVNCGVLLYCKKLHFFLLCFVFVKWDR